MVTVPSRTRMALCIGFQRVSRRYIAGWRGSSKNPAFYSRCTKDSNVDPAEVSQNGGFRDLFAASVRHLPCIVKSSTAVYELPIRAFLSLGYVGVSVAFVRR